MSNHRLLLESGRISEITKSKAHYEQLLQFHWEFYSELAFQRNRVYESLKKSLRERAIPFEFTGWQRALKYKYSLDPLGTKGSLTDPGGRFNIGAIDPIRYPVFPALYVASEKGTAIAELLGRDDDSTSLTREELALTKKDSISVVSVNGRFESVLNVRERSNLTAFVNLIRTFKLSKALLLKARMLGLSPVPLIRTVAELNLVLQDRNWRDWPMLFDVPSSTQIFGRIVLDAGIEGILYNSVLTQKSCMAIYPQNFLNSTSFVELADAAPTETLRRRIDSSTLKPSA